MFNKKFEISARAIAPGNKFDLAGEECIAVRVCTCNPEITSIRYGIRSRKGPKIYVLQLPSDFVLKITR